MIDFKSIFKDRGVPIQFVDLKQKPMSPGEIRRFIERFGLAGLVDSDSSVWADAGLKYLKLSDEELLGRIERVHVHRLLERCGGALPVTGLFA